MAQFKVSEMACGACVKSITEALKAKDADVAVEANLEAGLVDVTSNLSDEAVRSVIEEAGFPAALA